MVGLFKGHLTHLSVPIQILGGIAKAIGLERAGVQTRHPFDQARGRARPCLQRGWQRGRDCRTRAPPPPRLAYRCRALLAPGGG